MFERNYRTLPMSYSFMTLPEPISGYNASDEITYTPALVDALLQDPHVISDLNRADMRFGKKGEKVSWEGIDCTNPDVYYAAIQANAHANDMHLTIDQVKVVVGYLHSARGKWVQSGVTSLPFGTLKLLLMSNSVGTFGRDDVYHRITIKNNQIHISHVFYTSQLFLFLKDITVDLGRPLIKKIHDYKIVEIDGAYRIDNISSKKSVRIDKEFYQRYMVPAVIDNLNVKTELSAPLDGGVSMDIFAPVPFLSDKGVAEIFFGKILEPVEIPSKSTQVSRFKTLSVPEKIQLADYYISLSYDDFPKKKNKLRKQLYTKELKSLIHDESFDKTQRLQARQMLRQIAVLPQRLQEKYSHVITDILECTSKSIREPHDFKHVMQLETAARFFTGKSWAKKLTAAVAVFIGITILTVSVMAAVASFGGTSVLSVAGISVGTNLVIQSLALSSSVLGGFIAACGVAYSRYSPLKNFYHSTLPFWKGKKPVAGSQMDASQTDAHLTAPYITPGEFETPGEQETSVTRATESASTHHDKPTPPGGAYLAAYRDVDDSKNIQDLTGDLRAHRM